MNFRVEFYETEAGDSPVQEFLSQLTPKMHAKVVDMLKLLEEYGNALREPYSSSLEDGIFELRCKVGSDITRELYFFYVGRRIIVTNGFIKKTQKTPRAEIILAKKRRADFIKREESR